MVDGFVSRLTAPWMVLRATTVPSSPAPSAPRFAASGPDRPVASERVAMVPFGAVCRRRTQPGTMVTPHTEHGPAEEASHALGKGGVGDGSAARVCATGDAGWDEPA